MTHLRAGKATLSLLIGALLMVAFCLGMPAFHYAAALMIALLIRHRGAPRGLFATVDSFRLF